MNVVTFRTVAAGSVDYWLLSLHESGLRSGITTHDQASLPTWAPVSLIIKWGEERLLLRGTRGRKASAQSCALWYSTSISSLSLCRLRIEWLKIQERERAGEASAVSRDSTAFISISPV